MNKTKTIYCFEDKGLKLKDYLLKSKIINNLRDDIDIYDITSDDCLFTVQKTIPCVIYLENRINKKIITIIIVEGIRKRSSFRVLDKYVKQIEYLFNNGVMCEKNSEWQLNHDSYEIAPIFSSNSTSRKVIKNIKNLFDTVFKMYVENSRRHLFKDLSICIKRLYQLLDNEMTSLIMK